MSTVGAVIGGRFRIDHVLGSGGMGVVVSATHLELGHRVAIKFLRDEMALTPTVVERFLREARAAVQLKTEHVCRVIDVGRTDAGAPYIVMEMLEGNDLGRVVASQPLPSTIAVEYVMQACVAIAEAHAVGIVHRDLKPANLLVTRRPGGGALVKVLDFGIAKAMTEAGAQLTQSRSMLGSPGYISPEQLHSARDVDVRTDIWALGATLYQLLSARLPFYRPNVTEMAVRIVMEPPDPLDVDPALRAVVFRCLAKSPAERYPSVAALVAELAPFGGPSGHALAAMVVQLARGSIAWPAALPPVSATAMTAASSVASNGFPSEVAAPRAPPPPRRPWWWIAAPLIVLGAAGAVVIAARGGSTEGTTPPPAATVAAVPVVPVVPVDAAVADAAPPDAPLAAVAPARPKDARPKVAPARPPRPRDATAGSAPASTASPARSATLSGSVAETAREATATCLESAADTPWNTAMCWCTKKDRARAQAAFAKLSGFKRTTVRRYCAVRGVAL